MVAKKSKDKLKVLIISGGGVYGVIPCYFLKHLNKQNIQQIDVFGGTSVGGIISLHLSSNLNPCKLYEDFKGNIRDFFQRKLLNIISPFYPKYDTNSLEQSLKNFLPINVSQCERYFVVPTFNLKTLSPLIFHNFDNSYFHMKTWQVARSTSAAPMYYAPYSQNILIDGGILQNVPIITTAAMICKYLNKKPSDLDIFAIGTGVSNQEKDYTRTNKQVSKYTKLDWAKTLMPIITTGGNEMMSELWGQNMGFNSFKMFNPVITDGIMDNIDKIDIIQQKCEIYCGQFLKEWNKFIKQ